jgi:hypothetical protein
MIISPPFLPDSSATSSGDQMIDPMMDAVDAYELAHGIYPIAFDRRWHTGVHLMPSTQNERVRAIADGEVIAYRVCQKAVDDGSGKLNSNAGFVLLKHQTETGEGRSITFYSLYMHLLELDGYVGLGVSKDSLPEFLQAASPGEVLMVPTAPPPAQSGGGKKVYRKDVLGLAGRCHDQKHLHFEIFMLPDDFNAYFGSTQLDNKNPTTPAGTDYWGHSYYIIPSGQPFLAKPTGADADGILNGFKFEPLPGGANPTTLHVETYFHKGTRYTSTWSVAVDGTRTPLTSQPVADPDYEYDLYDRATKLYKDCPSDGYELLRFGRILSSQPILAAGAARATWMRMTFASGKEGYIDVNSDSVIKLSDADFPFFTGWRKISKADGNTPFKNDGMCDADELKKIIGDVAATTWAPSESQDEDALSEYVKNNDAIRKKLKGFVCHAPTEWDSTQNETRYAALDAPDGFFGKQAALDPTGTGYSDFLALLKKFQFWDKTGLPSGELWFFHPLQFIRHFRKCGWLRAEEMAQCIPHTLLRLYHADFVTDTIGWHAAISRATDWVDAFNRGTRKYGIDGSKLRLLQLFSHVIPETGCLSQVVEGNGENASYAPYYGRGLIQLTSTENYKSYGDFRKFPSSSATPTKYSALGWDPDEFIAKDNQGNRNTENCVDSACFYIVKRSNMLRHMDAGCSQDQAITVSEDVNGYVDIEKLNGLELRLQGVMYLRNILLDEIFDSDSVPITFDWRRNSKKEPKLDAQGHPVMVGHPPKGVMMFYKKTWTIQASVRRQQP